MFSFLLTMRKLRTSFVEKLDFPYPDAPWNTVVLNILALLQVSRKQNIIYKWSSAVTNFSDSGS